MNLARSLCSKAAGLVAQGRLPQGPMILVLCAVLLSGCGHVMELTKTIWGSSTRALEEARIDAVRKTYGCGFEECYDAVLSAAEEHEMIVFQKSRLREFIVLMKVPDVVDTTEVGVFFSSLGGKTRIDISSLSTPAKENAAGVIFTALAEAFPEEEDL